MSFPLKPFLYLCLHSPDTMEGSAFTDYCFGVAALAAKLGPILPERNDYPRVPQRLHTWTCQDIAKILNLSEEAIFWTIIELDRESPVCHNKHAGQCQT